MTCTIETFFAVRDALDKRFGAPENAALEWRPSTLVMLDEEAATGVLKLVDVLDELDDVQNVWANFDLPEELAQRLSA